MDLSKDLIVVYGKNNIGKSYAISVVYLLLKQFLEIDRFQLEKIINSEFKYENYLELQKEIQEGKEYNSTSQISATIKNILHIALAERLENSFKNTYGPLSALKNFKADGIPSIQLQIFNHVIRIKVGTKFEVKEFSLDRSLFLKAPDTKRGYETSSDRYTLAVRTEESFFKESLNAFMSHLIHEMLDRLAREFGHIYFLPASRSGLYTGMQSFLPIITELSKNRAYITRKVELPGMSEPIADYILRLSEISGIPTDNNKLNSIVAMMEKEILGGEIGFDKDKTKLTYSPTGSNLTLDMNNVSSMVSELSPLAAFIKYILGEKTNSSDKTPKPVIFIEEPEAHLHPQAQVLLVEVFLKLIKAGVKVIVTSHSNTIFNKLSNMLMAGSLTHEQFAPIVLNETPEGSISRLMESDALGIEDENFIDTVDALYNEREQIIEQLNKASHDQ